MNSTNPLVRHFTATTFIVAKDRILLLEHKKLGTWLPPGGHVEPNELPHQAVLREIMEETGLEVKLFFDKNFDKQKNFLNKKGGRTQLVPRPWKILLEKIAKDHYHIDFTFLANAKEKKACNKEGHQSKWFTEKELEQNKALLFDVKYFAKMAIKKYKTARKQDKGST